LTDLTYIPKRPRKAAPRLAKIAQHWANHPDWPDNRLTADPTKPRCIRCGFTAPCKTWEEATGWIEISHLHDHAYGGDTDIDNLVPLCSPCNNEMKNSPSHNGRADGLTWVKTWRLRDRDILSALIRIHVAERSEPTPSHRRKVLSRALRQMGDLMATYPDPANVLNMLAVIERFQQEWQVEAKAEQAIGAGA
jgi:5-methylcytosine-specific restriction endonuclease McrA